MSLRVLVIEDDAMTSMLVDSLLVEAGHTVRTANDTDRAKQLVESEPFDALIADWSVPGEFSTVDIATRMLEINSRSKVVFTSGYHPDYLSGIPDRIRKLPFFQKPVDYAAVISVIEAKA